jgi:hypothetical protein
VQFGQQILFLLKVCGTLLMRRIREICAITVLAVVIGIVTVGPAMADKDSAPGQNKIDICHYDKDAGEHKRKTIPEKAAQSHEKNHENDIVPAPEEGCPDQDVEELESGDSIDMNTLLGMFTEIVIFEQEVENLQNQIDNMNGGENENFKIVHLIDEDGSQWNPNDSQRHFQITDEAISSLSVVSITIMNPSGVNTFNPECNGHVIENTDGTYVLEVDCISWVPEGTQLNYLVINPVP